MANVRADMHIHCERLGPYKTLKEYLIYVLQTAQKQGNRAIALLQRNSVDMYLEGGALSDLIYSGEIDKYFSGKIIPAVEMSCTVDYEGNYKQDTIHTLLYGMDPRGLAREDMLNPACRDEFRKADWESFCKKCKAYGIELPEEVDINKGVATQVWMYLEKHKDEANCKPFVDKYEDKSKFSRLCTEDKNGELFITFAAHPILSKFLDVGKKHRAMTILAHPANMKDTYDTVDYLDVFGCYFDGVEGEYKDNTLEETARIEKWAKRNDKILTAGSDFQFFVEGNDGIDAPNIGITRRDRGSRQLYVDEEIIARLPDIREIYLSRKLEKLLQAAKRLQGKDSA